MANTVTVTNTVIGQSTTVVYATVVYVDTNETNTVIYDSSVICAALGIADTLKCRVWRVFALASTATTARIKLLFDASSPVLAMGVSNGANPVDTCFRSAGGLSNYAGAGKTGDITLTTTGLGTGDTITLVLEVRTS